MVQFYNQLIGHFMKAVPWLAGKTRISSIGAVIVIINILAFYYLFIYFRYNKITDSKFKQYETNLSPSFMYSLDSECKSNLNESSSQQRQKVFDDIFENGVWNRMADQSGSRSGSGSSIPGAFDWIKHLQTFLRRYSIRSVADIPCGDTYWQFSLREMNTIEELYFGGDISTNVIKQNQRLYGSKHRNKVFRYWDLVNCPIPTYTYRNSTHEIKGNHFDLIIVRDALQHMHIKNGLKAVRNVIMSGAKFFAVSTYPPSESPSVPNTRSLTENESLPFIPINCTNTNYCTIGQIQDGGFYFNNINCYPFNFPLNKAILIQPSHATFHEEHDQIHIYKIDEELKKVVEQYDKACL